MDYISEMSEGFSIVGLNLAQKNLSQYTTDIAHMDMVQLNAWMDQCVAFAYVMNQAVVSHIPLSLIDFDSTTGELIQYGQVIYRA